MRSYRLSVRSRAGAIALGIVVLGIGIVVIVSGIALLIGVAAIAPALLLLWLVIAADERPGRPTRVWLAFILGAASISLLGIARAPFAAILAVPGNPWMTQGLRSIFGVAAPEEIVKILVIILVSIRRRTFADPMDTVVYGAAAGLGLVGVAPPLLVE